VDVVGMAVVDRGRFLVLADDDGGLTCINRANSAVLWSRRTHDSGVCGVVAVGETADEQILSVDRHGGFVVTDPVTGLRAGGWQLPGCNAETPHRHLLEASWDRRHLVTSCVQALPPGLVALGDAAAAHGFLVHVHDDGGHLALMDRTGMELARTGTVTRPFAVGVSTQVAYLRAPGHWVGVRDLVTDEEVTACRHCYERGGYAVALSPDERRVAWSGYEKYGAREETREFVRVVGMDPPEDYGRDVIRGPAEFTSLRFSSDGRLLLAGDSEGAVSLVQVTAGGPPHLLGAVDYGVAGLDFADAVTVVAVGTAGEVCSWPVPADLLPA
jgi:hypothetical protein